MAGGLLNLNSVGSANVFLTGNPTKTFFKVVYSKYTNFGLQKFRVDYDGVRDLRLTGASLFQFKIPRYADLLMDTYLCVSLPSIWSPIYHPCENTGNKWAPYEFRWIRDLGTSLISEISITCGSLVLQTFTGQYLSAMLSRDFSADKKAMFDKMSGNTAEYYSPENAVGRINTYPSAYYLGSGVQVEPSIRSSNIYIPLNLWFGLDSRCAFPLIALRYSELTINITVRPIQELFQVRDVFDPANGYPYMQPDFTQPQFAMYRFLQQPPSVDISPAKYANTVSTWNADVHLLCTYCFLSEEERKKFAMEDQIYLVKDVFQYNFENIVGSKRVSLTSNGMIANWMWYFQRNDAKMRNEWTNYTNWPYASVPVDLIIAPQNSTEPDIVPYAPLTHPPEAGEAVGTNTGLYITGEFSQDNVRDIMVSMGIVLNGDYRENTLPAEVYQYVEPYARSNGSGRRGLYCYNFCLNSSPFDYQPSGAMNLTKFTEIELEVTTVVPIFSLQNSNFNVICGQDGTPIGISKQNWRLYDYTYNMVLFEERYNILSFVGGNCGMIYAR